MCCVVENGRERVISRHTLVEKGDWIVRKSTFQQIMRGEKKKEMWSQLLGHLGGFPTIDGRSYRRNLV